MHLDEGFPDSNEIHKLATDNRMQLNVGFDGGFHVYLQLCPRVYPGQVTMVSQLRESNPLGQPLRDPQTQTVEFVCQEMVGWVLRQGQPTFICPSVQPVPLHDRMLDLDVTLSAGTDELTQSFTIEPTCPTDDPDAYAACVKACGGEI